jgi:hypothetical protein
MCCVLTIFIFLGPRFAAVVWWLVSPVRWVGETNASAFGSFIWPLLGIIFLPWTTIFYVMVAPGGIEGFWEWLILILSFILDLGAYSGGAIGNRKRIPGMG